MDCGSPSESKAAQKECSMMMKELSEKSRKRLEDVISESEAEAESMRQALSDLSWVEEPEKWLETYFGKDGDGILDGRRMVELVGECLETRKRDFIEIRIANALLKNNVEIPWMANDISWMLTWGSLVDHLRKEEEEEENARMDALRREMEAQDEEE